MQNWIMNRIVIKSDYNVIAEMLKSVASAKSIFDFEKIIPIPDALNIAYCRKGEIGHAIVKNDCAFLKDLLALPEYQEKGITSVEKLIEVIRAQQPEALALGQQYFDNEKQLGYATWYHWCVDKWGSKWNAHEASCTIKDKVLEIRFITPWSDPHDVLLQWSTMFPEVCIENNIIDPQDNNEILKAYVNGHYVEY